MSSAAGGRRGGGSPGVKLAGSAAGSEFGEMESVSSNSIFTATKLKDKLKKGIFGILFVLVKDTRHSIVYIFFELFTDFFQVLGFAFSPSVDFPWNGPQTLWLQKALKVFSPEKYVIGESGWFYAVISLVFFALAISLFVAYSFFKNRYRALFLLRILRQFGEMLTTILLMPFLGIMAGMIPCHEGEDCGSIEKTIHRILACVFGVLFFFFSLVVTSCYYEQNPTRKTLLSRPHAHFDVFYLVVRAFLAVIYEILYRNQYHWVLISLNAIGMVSSAALFTFLIPYHNEMINKVRMVFTWLCAFASLCLIVAKITDDPSASQASLFFYLMAPVVAALSVFVYTWRKNLALQMRVKQCQSVYEVEVRVRLLLDSKKLLRKSFSNPSVQGETVSVTREINGFYAEAAKRFPESPLIHIFWGQFYLHHMERRNLALTEFVKAGDKHPTFDVQFLLFRQRQLLTEDVTFNKNNMDAMAFVAYEKNLQEAKKYERKATRLQALFWKELSEDKPNRKVLYEYGVEVSDSITRGRRSFIKLIEASGTSPQLLRMYAGFLLYVARDARTSDALLSQADALETQQSEIRRREALSQQKSDAMTSYTDSTSATVTVSADLERVGEIVDVSGSACKFFGCRKSEMVGQNITCLMPPPFSLVHNDIMTAYIEGGADENSVIRLQRVVLARHKSGNILPVRLVIRQYYREPHGVVLIGQFSPINLEGAHRILIDKDGDIISHTANIGVAFGGHQDENFRGHSLSTVLPGYAHSPQVGAEPFVTVVRQLVNQTVVEFKAEVEWLSLHDIMYGVVALTSRPIDMAPDDGGHLHEGGASEDADDAMLMSVGLGHIVQPQLEADGPTVDSNGGQRIRSATGGAFGSLRGGSRGLGSVMSDSGMGLGGRDASRDEPLLEKVLKKNVSVRFVDEDDKPESEVDGERRGSEMSTVGAEEVIEPDAIQMKIINQKRLNSFESNRSSPKPKLAPGMPVGAYAFSAASDNEESVAPADALEREGSVSSARSTASASKIAKFVSARNKKMIIEPVLYRGFMFVMCGAFLIATTISVLNLTNSTNSFKESITCVIASSHLREDSVVGSLQARTLSLMAEGLMQNTSTQEERREDLIELQEEMLDATSELYFQGKCITEDIRQYYKTLLPFTVFPTGNFSDPLVTYMTLVQATQTFASDAVDLSNRTFDEMLQDAPDGLFLISNGVGNYLKAADAATTLYVHAVEDAADALKRQSESVSWPPFAILTSVLIAIVIPILYKVDRRMSVVLNLFLSIPKSMVQHRARTMTKRLESLDEEDSDDEMNENVGDDSELTGGAGEGLSVSFELSPKDKHGRCLPPLSSIHSALSQQRKALLKSLIYIPILLAYGIALSIMVDDLHNTTSSAGPDIIWSGRREFTMRQILFYLREAAVANTTESLDAAVFGLNSAMAETKMIDTGVVYGNTTMGTAGTGRLAALRELLQGDACIKTNVLGFEHANSDSPEDCDTFANGLLLRGVETALASYMEKSDRLARKFAAVPRPTSTAQITAMLDDPDLAHVDKLILRYIHPAAEASTGLLIINANNAVNTYQKNSEILLIVVNVFMGISFIFVFYPLSRALEASIRNSRMLLMLFPFEHVINRGLINAYLEDI